MSQGTQPENGGDKLKDCVKENEDIKDNTKDESVEKKEDKQEIKQIDECEVTDDKVFQEIEKPEPIDAPKRRTKVKSVTDVQEIKKPEPIDAPKIRDRVKSVTDVQEIKKPEPIDAPKIRDRVKSVTDVQDSKYSNLWETNERKNNNMHSAKHRKNIPVYPQSKGKSEGKKKNIRKKDKGRRVIKKKRRSTSGISFKNFIFFFFPPYHDGKCNCLTKNWERCKITAQRDSLYCHIHIKYFNRIYH